MFKKQYENHLHRPHKKYLFKNPRQNLLSKFRHLILIYYGVQCKTHICKQNRDMTERHTFMFCLNVLGADKVLSSYVLPFCHVCYTYLSYRQIIRYEIAPYLHLILLNYFQCCIDLDVSYFNNDQLRLYISFYCIQRGN